MTVRTREQLEDAADVIRDETAEGGNTPARVGGFCRDVVDSMPLADEVTAGAPWSRVLFVDSGSAVTPPDGSRDAPFTTVQAAHDAATAGSTIRVIAYTAAGGLTVTKDIVIAADRVFTRRPFGGYSRAGENIGLGAITVSAGTLSLSGVNVSTISAAGRTVNITDACDVSGAVSAAELRAADSDFGADIALSFASLFSNCRFATGVDITTSVIALSFASCHWTGTVSIVFSGSAGVVTLDIVSAFYWAAATETLTNGTLSIVGNVFSSTSPGLVPASGGGTTNFLRADNSFAAPPTAPTGTAGGSLSGTYPNPGIAPNSVGSDELADMDEGTVVGREEGAGTGNPTALTATQLRTIINMVLSQVLAGGNTTGANNLGISAEQALQLIAGTPTTAGPPNAKIEFLREGGGTSSTIGLGTSNNLRISASDRLVLEGLASGVSIDVLAGSSAILTLAGGTGGTAVTAQGTGEVTVDKLRALQYREVHVIGSSGADETIDWTIATARGNLQHLTLSANCAIEFVDPEMPTFLTLMLLQDGTGGRTITLPARVKNAAAVIAALTTTAATISVIQFFYTGAYFGQVMCTGVTP